MNVADAALSWLERGGVQFRGRGGVFDRFPELAPEVMIDRLVELWPRSAELGWFRDAVEHVLVRLSDADADMLLPRVSAILHSSAHSVCARSLAYSVLQNSLYPLGEEQLAPEELRAIIVDWDSDCAPAAESFDPGSRYFEESSWHRTHEQLEPVRRRAGAPYALAWYRAALHDTTPDHVVSRIERGACLTSSLLIEFALPEAKGAARAARLRDALGALEERDGDPGSAAPDEGFRPARFWKGTTRDGATLVASWTHSERPGGNLVVLALAPDGFASYYGEARVPVIERPPEILGALPTPIGAAEALATFRDAWRRFPRRLPAPDRLTERGMLIEVVGAAAAIEDAAVQTLVAAGRAR